MLSIDDFYFFFQAEDGIRDIGVTGVQTCALPILISAVPDVAGISPVIIRIVVVLPAPFGPRKPVTVPDSSSKDTSSTTVRSPYFLVSPLTVIIVASSDRLVRSRGRRSRRRAPRRVGRAVRPGTTEVATPSAESRHRRRRAGDAGDDRRAGRA